MQRPYLYSLLRFFVSCCVVTACASSGKSVKIPSVLPGSYYYVVGAMGRGSGVGFRVPLPSPIDSTLVIDSLVVHNYALRFSVITRFGERAVEAYYANPTQEPRFEKDGETTTVIQPERLPDRYAYPADFTPAWLYVRGQGKQKRITIHLTPIQQLIK
jgi:hypothetical protein